MSASELDPAKLITTKAKKLLPMIDQEPTGNACTESGCMGWCCNNILFLNITHSTLSVLAPSTTTNQVEVPREELSDKYERRNRKRGDAEHTVYFSTNANGTIDASLDGDCPNKQTDGSCGIYNRRPEPCVTFEFGSKPCNDIRKKNGVPPVPGSTSEKKRPIRKLFRFI